MDLDVTPTPGPTERRALLLALGRADATARTGDPHRQAWRVAGLRESVESEDEDGYAFSPRSTRGATRA